MTGRDLVGYGATPPDPRWPGGARLAGRQNMIGALAALGRVDADSLPDKMAAFGISGRRGEGFRRLFMSHPPIEERIAALQASAAA